MAAKWLDLNNLIFNYQEAFGDEILGGFSYDYIFTVLSFCCKAFYSSREMGFGGTR